MTKKKPKRASSGRPLFNRLLLRMYIAAGYPSSNKALQKCALTVEKMLRSVGGRESRFLGRCSYNNNYLNKWKQRNRNRILLLRTEAIPWSSCMSPLVPPEYGNQQRDHSYKNLSDAERRRITKERQLSRGLNNMKRVHKLSGYSGEYILRRAQGVDRGEGDKVAPLKIIDTCTYTHGRITVVLPESGSETFIEFQCKDGIFSKEMTMLNDNCRVLGGLWGDTNLQHVRTDMMKVGTVRFGDGEEVNLPSMERLGDNGRKVVQAVSVSAADLLQKSMPCLYQDITNGQPSLPVPDAMGGEAGLCPVIFQSRNLENEAHFDYRDLSRCCVCWSSADGKDHNGWFLVFPDVMYNDKSEGVTYHGIAVRLRDGILVSWDGRKIHHCSSRPSGDVDTWGTWFGSTTSALGAR